MQFAVIDSSNLTIKVTNWLSIGTAPDMLSTPPLTTLNGQPNGMVVYPVKIMNNADTGGGGALEVQGTEANNHATTANPVVVSGLDNTGYQQALFTDADGSLNVTSPMQVTGDSMTLVAAGDYAAGDVMSGSTTVAIPWVFTGIVRDDGEAGTIVRATITTSVPAFAARLRLWLFHTTPVLSNLNDNIAFNLNIAERGFLIGYMDFAVSQNIGGVSYVQTTTPLPITTGSGITNIFGILQLLDALTNEVAGMTVAIGVEVQSS